MRRLVSFSVSWSGRRLLLAGGLWLLLLLSSVSLTPVLADTTTGKNWVGTFFDNTGFAGQPVIENVVYSTGLYFNWGYDAPKNNSGNTLPVPANYFSAIFVSYQKFGTGDYHFVARANDGIRVYIEGRLVLDQMIYVTDGEFYKLYEFNVPLEEGQYQIRVEYTEYTGQSFLHLQWDRAGAAGVFYPDLRFCFAPGQATAAAYLVYGSVHVYTVDQRSRGTLALNVTAAQLAALPAVPATNTLIGSAHQGKIQFYKLSTGEYQLNVGPSIDGKTYECVFDSLPPTTVRVSSFELYQP